MGKLAVVFIAILAIFLHIKLVESHHNEFLPLAGETWLARQIEANQSYTYCLDSRAESYPGFSVQVSQEAAEYEARTGIRGIKVAFTTSTACQVQHVMLPAFPCSAGASACIYYASAPVVIHYKEELGYVSWLTTTGHELGHGLLNLHEQYIDLGSIRCDSSRTDTVMSCGTGVQFPTVRDVDLGCSLYGSWCGPEAPDPRGPVIVDGIAWGACGGHNGLMRWTSDIKANGESGMWRQGGAYVGYFPGTGHVRAPAC